MNSRYVALSLFLCLVSCGTVSVRSNPKEAEVILMQPGKLDPMLLGKTPYSASMSDLGNAANSGPIVLEIRKEGYISQFLYIPNASGARIEFDTGLKPINPGSYADVNKIIKITLQAERQIMQKQFDEAIKSAAAIKAMNENITAAWEIEGAAYFVKGELTKARVAWMRSLEIDPDNPDTVRMLKELQKKAPTK